MAKGLKTLVKLAVAAAGVYAVGKYIHDYTDYKLAEKKDLDELKNGGEHVKEAAKRTYIAIKTGNDVNQPASELGTAVAEVAGDAGKIMNAAGANTKEFALNEKEKYMSNPVEYRAKVAENIKNMGQQATGIFSGLKADAEEIITDIRESAESLRYDQDDYVDGAAEKKEEKAEPVEGGFMEVSEEPLYSEEPGKQYADITPAEAKPEVKPEAQPEVKLEVKPEEKPEERKEKGKEKAAEAAKKASEEKGFVVSEDPEEIKQ